MIRPKRLRLDDQLCFALDAATHMVTRAYRPLLKQIGLTYPQYLVMLVLWQDGESLAGHLAERLSLPASAVSPVLDRLEESGLVGRRRDDADRRAVSVALTTSGAALEKAASLAQQTVAYRTELDPDALDELREELKTLVRRMAAESAAATEDSRARQVGTARTSRRA
jgi:DNA-binding MarR family transcriptional regulator